MNLSKRKVANKLGLRFGKLNLKKGTYSVSVKNIKKRFSEFDKGNSRAKLILDSLTEKEKIRLLSHAIEDIEEAIYEHALATLKEVDARLPK